MKRRNKSSKVPNVKLRPAQKHEVTRLARQDSSILAEDSQLGSDDTAIIDLCPRPFRGVVICATGIADKPTLFKQALELGATSTQAFTDRVTHLIASDHGGAKYNCALERKIPILMSSWITESFQIWQRGDDVELIESMKGHRLPIFSGVVLCPSGITDIVRRTQIHKLVTENGGTYMTNLERPVRVTHLLCSGDEETDKMRYAEKFNSRGEASVHLVWEEWLWDSLEFGGRFDEEKYQVRRPRPERKSTNDDGFSNSCPPQTHNQQDGKGSYTSSELSQEETEEELASVQRLPDVTLQLWGSLLNRHGYEISDGSIMKSPSKKAPSPLRQPEPEKKSGSLISQFRRSNSFAPARPEAGSLSRPQPFKRAKTMIDITLRNDSAEAAQTISENGEPSTSAKNKFFSGLKFVALGEAKSPSVRTAIEENGGRIISEVDDENIDFVIVRLISGSKYYREEGDETLKAKYRTECWLEHCVYQERVCPSGDHITFLPLTIAAPIEGAEEVILTFSGLDQARAMWVTRLLRGLGIQLDQVFSRRTTHLLCPSAAGQKFDKAREWGTPVITMEWLATAATTGLIPPVADFVVPGFQLINPQPESRTERIVTNTDRKGKGKAPVLVQEPSIEIPSNGARDGHLPRSLAERRAMVQDSGQHRPSVSPRKTPIRFGRVGGLLATSKPQQRPTSPVTPTRAKSSHALFLRETTKSTINSTTPSRSHSIPAFHAKAIPSPITNGTLSTPSSASNPEREPTAREVEQEKKEARIPSSRTPSPLKTPQRLESPARIPREVAKALEDNITRLLGKRQSPESEPTRPPDRLAKRKRPTRISRQPSAAQSATDISTPPLPVFDDPMNRLETIDELNCLESGPEQMRVTYEDPKQQEETKRLMSLLNGGPRVDPTAVEGKGASQSSVRTRRSSRIAGF